MNPKMTKLGNWIVYLFILFTVMYLGAHVLASIIIQNSR